MGRENSIVNSFCVTVKNQATFSKEFFMTSFEKLGSGGEEIRVCPKLRSGGMAYAFSSSGRYVRLVSDIPSEGTSGSWYDSSTRVSFDDINNLLDTKGTLQTRDFVFLFHQNTANNAPMLTAALVNEGVLRKGPHGQYYAGFKRL